MAAVIAAIKMPTGGNLRTRTSLSLSLKDFQAHRREFRIYCFTKNDGGFDLSIGAFCGRERCKSNCRYSTLVPYHVYDG